MNRIVVATATCHKDALPFYWWALWLKALNETIETDLYIAVSDKAANGEWVKNGIIACQAAFKEVHVIPFIDKTKGYPHGANEMFKAAMTAAAEAKLPIAWIEPDMIPMWRGWWGAVVEDYFEKGKPFCGPTYPGHMNGTGIYPTNWRDYFSLDACPAATPFDVYIGPKVVPHAADSRLWQHDTRRPEFNTDSDVDAIPNPGVALYHPSKDGSLLRLLNQRLHLIDDKDLNVKSRWFVVRNAAATLNKLPGKTTSFRIGGSVWHAVKTTTAKELATLLSLYSTLSISEISQSDYDHYINRR